jgi:hypothetical protein
MSNPTWSELDFGLRDPHWYSYQFDSSGIAASAQFTASAFGDLDCDGVHSTFVRFGRIENAEVELSAGMYVSNGRE